MKEDGYVMKEKNKKSVEKFNQVPSIQNNFEVVSPPKTKRRLLGRMIFGHSNRRPQK